MLDTLSAVVKQCNFQDAKNTSKDACLLGPPSLEFAPYGRVPSSRVRKDGRQGTIDQDPEFIDFLQSLTEPMTRSNVNGEGVEASDTKPEKITTTPLVEYLKEKKANKSKEGAVPKPAKSQGKPEAKETKADKVDSKKVPVVKREAQHSPEKAKVEKATQDAVKAVNKSVAAMKGKKDASEPASPSPKAAPATPTTVKRVRERGSASIAAKILQRDLGLTPARGDRGTPRGANPTLKATGPEAERTTAPATSTTQPLDKPVEFVASTAPSQPNTALSTAPVSPPTGPRMIKTPVQTSQSANRSTSVSSARPSRLPPAPSPGAKSAFLKHANFSQGVTEDLLRAVFSTFGAVTRCEIDRKKGFGYVDFEETESLKKAMLASPVRVGDKGGQVVVLENKNLTTKPHTTTPQRVHNEGKVSVQLQTPPSTSTKLASVGDVPTASTVTTTPTAPRGAHLPFRGGTQHHGPRAGYNGTSRGGFNRAGRGGRANFRGRSTFDSNRGGGHGTAKIPGSSMATAPATHPASVSTSVMDSNTSGLAG